MCLGGTFSKFSDLAASSAQVLDAAVKELVQQQSKVCIQTFALLYIAAFLCIPNHELAHHWGLRDQV